MPADLCLLPIVFFGFLFLVHALTGGGRRLPH